MVFLADQATDARQGGKYHHKHTVIASPCEARDS